MAQGGGDEVKKIWKEYFEDLYNIETQEEVAVHMCGFDGIRRANCFGGETIVRVEVEVRIGKFKNGKAVGKGEITGERIKGDDRVVGWIWRYAVIVPLYKSKGEMTECKNYRGTILLNGVGKIYAGILIDRVRRVTGGFIDDEKGALEQGGGV